MRRADYAEFYSDPDRYDRQNGRLVEDIAFFAAQARKWGDLVLELACGTGRITIPLAAAGHQVVGLDLSAPMLEWGRRKAAVAGVRVDWVEADCRDFNLGKSFRLIFLPFNSLCHLHTREDLEGLLGSVQRHLAPGGRFIIDVFNPSLLLLTRDPARRYPVAEYDDPETGERVIVTEDNRYDPSTQVNHIRWYQTSGDRVQVKELNMRIYFPLELTALVHYNGLAVDEVYGDYAGAPFGPESARQILVLRRRDDG